MSITRNFDNESHRDGYKFDLIEWLPDEERDNIEDLFKEFDNAIEQCNDFEEQINGLNEEITDAKEHAGHLEDEANDLQEKLTEAEERIAELEQA